LLPASTIIPNAGTPGGLEVANELACNRANWFAIRERCSAAGQADLHLAGLNPISFQKIGYL
jgi:hypothetical protein